MKTLNILILCHVLVFQVHTSKDCKFWPYWNGCETRQTSDRETSCCSVLKRIFGGKCPRFCTTDSCNNAPQKISTWCGLTQNNTNNGMSCEVGIRQDNWYSRKNETKIFHSCCEPLDCKEEPEKQCYGDFGVNVVTIFLRKTCCPEGYIGWTCSGDYIRSTKNTIKPTTSKQSTFTTTTTMTTATEEPSTTTLSATTELSTEQVAESETTSTPLPDTPVASTTVIGKGTVPIKSPTNQNSQDQNIAKTVTLVGGVVGGLLGGVLVLLIWWGCRQRRQMHAVEVAMMPMKRVSLPSIGQQTPRPVVVPDLQTQEPGVIPDVCKRGPMPLPDDVYSNPYEEILADPVPRYTSVENLHNERPNYLLGGLSQIARDDADESAQSAGEETSRLYFVLEED